MVNAIHNPRLPMPVVAGRPTRTQVGRREAATAGAVNPSGTHAPVLITEQEVVFSTAAAQAPSRARRRWLRRTWIAAIGRILRPLPEPKSHYPRREPAYFEAARMSREMDRL
jgi:hypothetical protein